MATPGFPPPFGAPSGPNTATPSKHHIDPGARFLSHHLAGTRRIVPLSAQQLSPLTCQECLSLSPAESGLLALRDSTIYPLNFIGLRVDDLHTRLHDLGSQVANSLIGPRSGTSVTLLLTCHVMLHPLSLDIHFPLRFPTPPTNHTSGRPD